MVRPKSLEPDIWPNFHFVNFDGLIEKVKEYYIYFYYEQSIR